MLDRSFQLAEAPIEASIEIPEAEVLAFQSLLNEMATELNRSLPSLVEQAARFFAQSAGRLTKVSKKRRPAVTNPNRTGRGKAARGARYRFRIYRQGRDPIWIYTDDRMDARRLIKRQGLARNSWRALIPKIGKATTKLTGDSLTQRLARRAVEAVVIKRPEDAAITLFNRVSYMLNIAPHVQRDAMRKTHNRMNRLLELRRARMQEQWRT